SIDRTNPLLGRAYFKPEDIEYLKSFNKFVRQGDEGQLRAIWNRQYSVKIPSFNLRLGQYSNRVTLEQEEYLAKNSIIHYAYFPSGEAPFFDADGLFLDGYFQDIAGVIGRVVGITLKPVMFSSRADAIDALIRKDISLIPGISFADDSVADKLIATEQVDRAELSLVSRNLYRNLKDLDGKVMAAVSNSNVNNQIQKYVPSSPFLYFDTTTDALTAVADGRAEAFVGDQLSVTYLLTRIGIYNLNNISLGDQTDSGQITFEVSPSELDLFGLLNSAIQELDQTTIDEVTAKWRLSVKQVGVVDSEEMKLYAWLMVFVFAGMTSFLFYHRSQVNKMTQVQNQLEQALKDTETAHKEAQQLAKAKTEFLAKMSHEIRTPMNGVLGMAEALAFGPLDKEQKEQLEVLSGSAYNLMSLLNDVLDFSKMEAGKMVFSPVPSELTRLIHQAQANFEFSTKEKGVNLSIKIPNNMKYRVYNLDPVRCLQVLNNLVSNATKFTQKGFVEISVETIESHLNEDGTFKDKIRLQVRDSGIGLTLEQQKKLFTPFVQASDNITRRFGGSGLGLSICQEIVSALNGTIEVSSIEGVGSVFTLHFDALRLAEHSESPLEFDSHIPQYNFAHLGLSVLLVEDNRVNQKVLTGQLARLGMECDIAMNGQEGLFLYEQQHYDIVLSDFHMPVMDGLELARRLQALPQRSQSYLIAITADVFCDIEHALTAVGFDDYLSKPCTNNDLANVLAKAIEQLHPTFALNTNLLETEGSFHLSTDRDESINWLEDIDIIAIEAEENRSDQCFKKRFNPQAILDLNGGDLEITLDVLTDFVDTYKVDLTELGTAINEGDMTVVRNIAHKIKGVFMYLGCEQAKYLSNKLEKKLDMSSKVEMVQCFEVLCDEVEEIKIEVRNFINNKSKGQQ
ncbi:ATP-binding protein, partial [Vibrio sp. FNV 38]|nr:ATP-binding protein [Vibrio sp. FNV 38]